MTKKINNIVLRNILFPITGSIVVTILFHWTDFSWTYLIPVFIAPIFASVFEFNRNYLISLTPKDRDSSRIELVYYNFLDKTKTEILSTSDIKNMKRKKRYVYLLLPKQRELKLYLFNESRETLNNKSYI
jgi:hypothetical protein